MAGEQKWTGEEPQAGRGARLVPVAALAALALTCLALDQLGKWIALEALDPGRPLVVIPGFLSLDLNLNPHGAFGLFAGLPQGLRIPVLVCLSLVAMVAVGVVVGRSLGFRVATASALGLVIGGGLGNLVDRVFREGTVVDFILLRADGLFRWPTFNPADAAITAGVALLAILSIQSWRARRRAQAQEEAAQP
jgi:signal peptidase II